MNELDENVDPVALLGSLAAPTGWDERTDIDADEHAASIYERIVTGNVVPFRAPRRRLRVVTGIVVTVALGATAAAALWERSPQEARSLTCWSEPVSPPQAQIGLEWDGISDPVAGCESLWDGGELGSLPPSGQLNACVTEEGLAAVIPGDDQTCDVLGFAPYAPIDPGDVVPGSPDVAVLDIPKALEQIAARFNPETCASAEDAKRGVTEILNELGFDGWDVKIGSTESAAEPCAAVALDPEQNTAVIQFSRRAD